MARGQNTPTAILYGDGNKRSADVHAYRAVFPDLNAANTGICAGWFQGGGIDYSGWSGTGNWMARADWLPEEWGHYNHDENQLAREQTAIDSVHGHWLNGSLQQNLRSCRLLIANDNQPLITVSLDHTDLSESVYIPAGHVAAIEALAAKELERPEMAHWMFEEHGWYMAYVRDDEQIFGLVFPDNA